MDTMIRFYADYKETLELRNALAQQRGSDVMV